MPNSPASRAGLKAGDEILSVNGNKVSRFGGMGDDSIQWQIVRSERETIPITVARTVGDKTENLTMEARPIVPETKPWMREGAAANRNCSGRNPVGGESAAEQPGGKSGFGAERLNCRD